MYQLKVVREQVPTSIAHYGTKLNSAEDVACIARELLAQEDQEVMLVFFVNAQSKIIGYMECARGGIDSCQIDPRVVFRSALLLPSTSCIVACHNHPSGDINPSKQDIQLTMKLKSAGEMIGILLLDHVIISDRCKQHFSFMQDGILRG